MEQTQCKCSPQTVWICVEKQDTDCQDMTDVASETAPVEDGDDSPPLSTKEIKSAMSLLFRRPPSQNFDYALPTSLKGRRIIAWHGPWNKLQLIGCLVNNEGCLQSDFTDSASWIRTVFAW